MNGWIMFSFVGLIIMFLSYLVRYKKQAHLISGYDEGRVIDKDGFCNWFGGVMMLPGIYSIITSFLLWWYPAYDVIIVTAFGACLIVSVTIAIVGGQKYYKKI